MIQVEKKSGDQLIHDFDRARVNILFMSGIRVGEMMKFCQVDLVNLPQVTTFFHHCKWFFLDFIYQVRRCGSG